MLSWKGPWFVLVLESGSRHSSSTHRLIAISGRKALKAPPVTFFPFRTRLHARSLATFRESCILAEKKPRLRGRRSIPMLTKHTSVGSISSISARPRLPTKVWNTSGGRSRRTQVLLRLMLDWQRRYLRETGFMGHHLWMPCRKPRQLRSARSNLMTDCPKPTRLLGHSCPFTIGIGVKQKKNSRALWS